MRPKHPKPGKRKVNRQITVSKYGNYKGFVIRCLKNSQSDRAIKSFNKLINYKRPFEGDITDFFKHAYSNKQTDFPLIAFTLLLDRYGEEKLYDIAFPAFFILYKHETRDTFQEILNKLSYHFLLKFIHHVLQYDPWKYIVDLSEIYSSLYPSPKHLFELIQILAPHACDEVIQDIYTQHEPKFNSELNALLLRLANLYDIQLKLPKDTLEHQSSEGQGSPDMIHAVEQGDVITVKRLILTGVDVNSGDVILTACKLGYSSIVKLLLEAGANPDPWAGYTIKFANKYNYPKIKHMLVKAGVEDKAFSSEKIQPSVLTDQNGVVKLSSSELNQEELTKNSNHIIDDQTAIDTDIIKPSVLTDQNS